MEMMYIQGGRGYENNKVNNFYYMVPQQFFKKWEQAAFDKIIPWQILHLIKIIALWFYVILLSIKLWSLTSQPKENEKDDKKTLFLTIAVFLSQGQWK